MIQFSRWLPKGDLEHWERHFQTKGIPYEVRKEPDKKDNRRDSKYKTTRHAVFVEYVPLAAEELIALGYTIKTQGATEER